MRLPVFLTTSVLVIGLAALPVCAQPAKANAKDEATLFKNAASFVAAFHKADAKAVASHWSVDGDYVDQAGKHFKGRAAIEKVFQAFFEENRGLKLRINIESLRFVTPELAIEDGLTEVLSPDDVPPSRARYTIVHVKKDGEWQLASVRDAPYAPPGNYEHLRGLEWAIGDWADESDKGGTARISFHWSDTQNFIISSYTTTIKSVAIGGGTQWIGWDPIARHIRSWSFDVNGGFGEGVWAGDGKAWVIKSNAVLRDGKKATGTNTFTRIDANTITWQATQRTLDGAALPDVPAVRLKRLE